jgi:hypothetical protein
MKELIKLYGRQRGFGRGPRGHRWWMAPANHDGVFWAGRDQKQIKVTRVGFEYIGILEIVPTKALCDVALYRHWIVDPDGNELELEWLPSKATIEMRAMASLSRGIKTRRMQFIEGDTQAARDLAKLRQPANLYVPRKLSSREIDALLAVETASEHTKH